MNKQRARLSSTAWGGMAWLLIALFLVLLRGVRWDENYEFAQVILGQVPYPPDHPLALYTRGFFSLQTWSLAALMRFVSGPLLPNLLRNYACLLATVLPPFLFTSLWTRKARWGHAAALLLLMGIHTPFYSNYPVQVWPDMYSNGHIGLGWMLLSLYALSTGKLRLAWLGFGLAPAIHLGQFPPLLAVFSAWILWQGGQRRGREIRLAAIWGGGALACSLCFGLYVHAQALPIPDTGPFTAPLSPDAIFQGYMEHHASHRSIPRGTGHIAVGATLLAALALGLQGAKEKRLATIAPGVGYVLVSVLTLWGVMALHSLLGARIPWLVISWMPYRLMNHLSPLLLPMLIALLIDKKAAAPGGWVVLGALAYGVARPIAGQLLPEPLFQRYIATGEAVYFGLCGAALLRLLTPAWRRKAGWPITAIGVAIPFTALFMVHQYGAACLLLGAGVYALFRLRPLPVPSALCLPLCLALLTGLAIGEMRQRQHLPRSEFEKSVQRYLAEQGEGAAMIAAHYQQEGLQARLRHPVMTDMATMTWIPYKPALGPGLYALYRDLYGVNFAPATGEAPRQSPWFTVWPKKSGEEWRRLGRRYRFAWLITPAFMNLDLPCVLEEGGQKLYRIPAE